MQGAAVALGVRAEPMEIGDAVPLAEEARPAEMAALDHVQRVAGDLCMQMGLHLGES